MKKYLKLLFITLLTLLVISCGVLKPETFGSKVNKLEQGMTKREVVGILGDDYVTIRDSVDPVSNQAIEIIRYKGKCPEKSYSVRFVNGRFSDVSRM